MGKGIGPIQKRVLDSLKVERRRDEWVTLRRIISMVFGLPERAEFSRSQHSSLSRAVRSLERRELVEVRLVRYHTKFGGRTRALMVRLRVTSQGKGGVP
jgi:hypothetical protein